ncbi:MAG: hypothetical protein HC845_08190 [Akkermansiaceae bacterium]|nr:hypothetical protein [Akkermansiaceae bacterium]
MPKPPAASPEGFVIENPIDNTAEVFIENLPPPAEGNKQVLVLRDESGKSENIPIETIASTTPSALTLDGNWIDSTSLDFIGFLQPSGTNISRDNFVYMSHGHGSPVTFTLGNLGNGFSIQVVESPIIPSGSPSTVILDAGP